MDPAVIVIFWCICGIAAAVIGSSKSGALGAVFGVIVGGLLGPIGVLWALLSPGNRKRCPECRKWVDKHATRCAYCQAGV